jgi:hypothetical protein
MSRVLKKVDYEQTLELTIRLGDEIVKWCNARSLHKKNPPPRPSRYRPFLAGTQGLLWQWIAISYY